MPKKKNQSKSSKKQQSHGAPSQASVEQQSHGASQGTSHRASQVLPQPPPPPPPQVVQEQYVQPRKPHQEHYAQSHGPGQVYYHEKPQEPRRSTPEIPRAHEKMVNVDLSPPRIRQHREPRLQPSDAERTSHRAAIRHNLTLTNRVYSNVQDVAYQAGFEIKNAYKHPNQIPGRLGNAVKGAASGAANMGVGLGQAVVSEAGGAGMMLADGCGRLAQEAGTSAHRVAKRAARRAGNHLYGLEEQDGGMSGGYGTAYENIKHKEAEGDDDDACDWPEEEEKPKYKGYY
ncbi:hypothetical protein TWF506_008032 [Arthrobotrys conoides]|uniref:Uncharacterized protein n=1 Tax=Arthrobotrys conoides TaxID=74498 RepID=A0AAN8NKW6_9PEZI